ncbi:MAG: hypothetical protein WCB27_08875 [Thermoguttaceae bacterium]
MMKDECGFQGERGSGGCGGFLALLLFSGQRNVGPWARRGAGGG